MCSIQKNIHWDPSISQVAKISGVSPSPQFLYTLFQKKSLFLLSSISLHSLKYGGQAHAQLSCVLQSALVYPKAARTAYGHSSKENQKAILKEGIPNPRSNYRNEFPGRRRKEAPGRGPGEASSPGNPVRVRLAQ
jgi:hypothetical protein